MCNLVPALWHHPALLVASLSRRDIRHKLVARRGEIPEAEVEVSLEMGASLP